MNEKKYWVTCCPECGWKGLSRDCGGFGQIADTGDYDDGYCPRCGSIVEPDYEVPKKRIKWIWRKLTFWVFRKKRREKKEEQKWIERIKDLCE